MGGGGRAAHVHDFDSLSCCFSPPHRRTLQQIPPSFGRITLTLVWCKPVLLHLFLCVWKKSCNSRSSTTCPLSRFQVKFFYICQIAYWLHALPELYFQKVRKVSGGGERKGGLGQQGSPEFAGGSLKAKEFKCLFYSIFKRKTVQNISQCRNEGVVVNISQIIRFFGRTACHQVPFGSRRLILFAAS